MCESGQQSTATYRLRRWSLEKLAPCRARPSPSRVYVDMGREQQPVTQKAERCGGTCGAASVHTHTHTAHVRFHGLCGVKTLLSAQATPGHALSTYSG